MEICVLLKVYVSLSEALESDAQGTAEGKAGGGGRK